MIETKNEVSKNLEKALQELQRAKQHVANEKKKQNKKKHKAEKPKSRGNAITPFMGCAQIYHQRWYVRPSGSKFHLQWTMPAGCHMRRALSVLRQPKGEKVSKQPYTIPLHKLRLLPLNEAMLHFVNICVQTKAKVRLLSAHKVYKCAPLPCRQNLSAAYG